MDTSAEVIGLATVTVAVLTFGIIVLLRRQYDLTSRLAFFLQAVCSAVWTIASIARLTAVDADASLIAAKIVYISGAAIICSWVTLAVSFSKLSKFTPIAFGISAVSLFLLSALAILPGGAMINSVATPPSRDIIFGPAGWTFPMFISVFGLILAAILSANFATAKSRLERIRHLYVLFAVVFALIAIGVSDVLLPYFGIFYIYWLGPFTLILLNFMMSVALFRYRLLNVSSSGQNRLDSRSVIDVSLHVISNTDPQKMLDSVITRINKVDRISTVAIVVFSNGRRVFSGNPKQALQLEEITKIANSDFLQDKAIATEEIDTSSAEYHLFVSRQISALAIIGQPGAPVFGAIVIGNDFPVIYGETEITSLASIANIINIAFESSIYLHKNRELEQLDTAKDELLNIASHNLRTPLVVVRGYIELIMGDKEDVPSEKHLGYLNSADNEIIKMSRIVDDFLTLSRIQTGRFVLNKAPLDLRQVVQEVATSIQPLATDKNKEIELDIRDGNYDFELDDSKIRQVITGFIDNAIYYSGDSTQIIIHLYETNGRAVFEVEDHGIGVPEADRDKLWEKFSRASNAQAYRADGTGTGLYMIHRIVQDHGGTVIYRPLKTGSVFGFSLPRQPSQ